MEKMLLMLKKKSIDKVGNPWSLVIKWPSSVNEKLTRISSKGPWE